MLKYLADGNIVDVPILKENELRDYKFSLLSLFLKLQKAEN